MSHRNWCIRELNTFLDRYSLLDVTNKKVLEIGTSDDVEVKNYLESLNYEYAAIEKNEKHKEPYRIIADMNNMPFNDNSFDLVISIHSFEHTLDPIKSLQEMKRVSSKYIFIATPYPCRKQILEGDEDHLFILNELQMERLFRWCKIEKINIYCDNKQDREQDFNLIAIGEV